MRYWWILIIVAGVLILPGLVFFAASVSFLAEEPVEDDPTTEEDEGNDPVGLACFTFSICVAPFWLPAIILIIIAIVGKKDNKGLSELAEVMRVHDSLKVSEAASTFGLTYAQARKRMAKCVNRNMVNGRMKNDVYYSPAYLKIAENNLKRKEFLIDMADILKAYRRVTIEDFGTRIKMDPWDAEKVMLECMEDGHVNGYISRRSKTFFTRDYLDQLGNVQFGWSCRGCGARNTDLLLPGEVENCPYCGLVSEATGTEPRYLAFEVIE